MNDHELTDVPPIVEAIRRETERMGFAMASEPQTGSLLRALAASKPGGRLLELGTGTGFGTAWILAGMDDRSRLETVENDAQVLEVARRHLGHDARVTFHLAEGEAFLAAQAPRAFDVIFADTWPGKFTHVETALSLLRVGGLYVVDDLLPQPSWPEGHAPRVSSLIADLERREGFIATKLAWASGIMILVRREGPGAR